ncbi:MAG: HAMP domain-containing histidine kinase [Deltaproteobacteria bacterium]|nr:HAMP domain-containing histidine kinase [Deltaproteobacteria bacterium]MBI3295672.1 HAMP domain-containing histidine kinase [Deltaproteobacteria bacterium]
MFACLLFLQYIAGIAAAFFISPQTWSGSQSSVHFHVWAATILGAVIVSAPIALAYFIPGQTLTRHVIAVAQMLDSALLIHLSGGRIETHFHVFGSLAFLGFYRDSWVLVSASIVVAVDHFLRGIYWPQSVYGVLNPSTWRWIEHTGWVLFEDFFIALGTQHSLREMKEIADRRADLEAVAQERAENIVRLKETQSQLQHSLEIRDSFLSLCGRELKSPLTTLKLFAELAQRTIEKSPSIDKAKQFIEQSQIHITRLHQLVDVILEVTRIRAGLLTLMREKCELNDLIQNTVLRYRHIALNSGCSIAIESTEIIHGWCDRARLDQVVGHLLSNAIKYGAFHPITISLSAEGVSAKIAIRDQGMGISNELRPRLFDGYGDLNRSTVATGFGLGLYVSKQIVEKHGGTLTVESELGKGSVFVVQLPLHSEDRVPNPPIREAKPVGFEAGHQ